jgi:hypothetical protein
MSKSNLYTHQHTAKFCLKLRGCPEQQFECEYCKKTYAQKNSLLIHTETCSEKHNVYVKRLEIDNTQYQFILQEKDKYYQEKNEAVGKLEAMVVSLQEKDKYYQEKIQEKNETILKLEAMVASLQKTINDIALQPKTTTNNTMNIMNRFDINDTKHIREVFEKHLTKEVIARGQEGVAIMVGEHLLTGEDGNFLYGCSDVSRQKFIFINQNGEVETDPKALKLINKMEESGLCDQAKAAADALWTKPDGSMDIDKYSVYAGKVTEVMQIDQDSSKLRAKLASITALQRKKQIE